MPRPPVPTRGKGVSHPGRGEKCRDVENRREQGRGEEVGAHPRAGPGRVGKAYIFGRSPCECRAGVGLAAGMGATGGPGVDLGQ